MQPHATDLRDLYRPGSTLTPRRLWLLIGRLPAEAQVRVEYEAKKQHTSDRIRERQALYSKGG